MYKLITALLVVGLLSMPFSMMGCAGLTGAVTGAEQLLCNPTPTQKADAAIAVMTTNAILAILTSIPNPTSAVAGLIVSVGGAASIFATVQRGGCVLVTQLADALAAITNAQTVAQVSTPPAAMATAMAKVSKAGPEKVSAFPVIPPLNALHDWIK